MLTGMQEYMSIVDKYKALNVSSLTLKNESAKIKRDVCFYDILKLVYGLDQ